MTRHLVQVVCQLAGCGDFNPIGQVVLEKTQRRAPLQIEAVTAMGVEEDHSECGDCVGELRYMLPFAASQKPLPEVGSASAELLW